MNIKKIKIFPIVAVLTTLGGSTFAIYKNNINKEIISISNDYSNVDNIIETTETTTATTTETTTVPVETIEPTTEVIETIEPTTINPYREIRFLENIDSNINLEEINDFIIKYAEYSKYSYDDAINIIHDNIESVKDYQTLKGYIMCTLFNNSSNEGLLSSTCNHSIVENRDMTLEEKETIMLDMCNALGLSNTDKTIVLSVFRHETGNGTSNRCVNDNNYGGIKVGNSFGVYQTPEYGIYKAIMCIDGHIERNKANLGTDDMYSIVSEMSYSYCPGTANDWTNKVISFCNTVSYDYNDFNDQYEYKIS